jgi:hypothetical protein
MANFATLADVIARCVTSVTPDACPKLYTAATPPKGAAPNDTLTAAQSIARAPWYQPTRVFALIDQFFPIPKGKNLRAVPYMPYLNTAPSAWVLPLKFDGGGYRRAVKPCSTARGAFGSATTSRSAGRRRIVYGRVMPPSSHRTAAVAKHTPSGVRNNSRLFEPVFSGCSIFTI